MYVVRQVPWKSQGLLHRLKMSRTLVHNRLEIGSSCYPPSVNSAFDFIARLRKWRSANETQPNFAKRWTANRANNLPWKSRDRFSQKWGNYISSVFRRLQNLMANIFGTKRDINNRQGYCKVQESPTLSQNSWTLVHKRLKMGPEFLPILNILFHPESIEHALSGINVGCTVNL